MIATNKYTPKTLVENVFHLISLPSVYTHLEETLKNPNHTREDIANVVRIDPALSARILRIVNSSYYSFPNPIEKISTAVNIIGENDLRNLVLVSSVVNSVSVLTVQGFDLSAFWQHSIRTGITAKLLAKQQSIPDPESLFLCGLLHDLGQLIIYHKEPELFKTLSGLASHEGRQRYQVEQELLGFDHALVGSLLIESWGLPTKLNKIIKYHHQDDSANPYPIETKLIYLADHLAQILELNTNKTILDTLPLSIKNSISDIQIQTEDLLDLSTKMVKQSLAIEAIICGD